MCLERSNEFVYMRHYPSPSKSQKIITKFIPASWNVRSGPAWTVRSRRAFNRGPRDGRAPGLWWWLKRSTPLIPCNCGLLALPPGAKGIATRSKYATRGSWPYY